MERAENKAKEELGEREKECVRERDKSENEERNDFASSNIKNASCIQETFGHKSHTHIHTNIHK